MISDLQKEILRLSLERKFVTSQEFLAELWGCKGQELATDDNAQYNVRHASLSRSLTRLFFPCFFPPIASFVAVLCTKSPAFRCAASACGRPSQWRRSISVPAAGRRS